MNLLQRFRAAFRAFTDSGVASGPWRGAEVNRLTSDWIAPVLTPDDALRAGLARVRARARDLERNNPYAEEYLSMLEVNVVGPHGFGHQAQVRDNNGRLNKMLNDRIEQGWATWGERATRDGKQSFLSLSHMMLRSWARDGDAFCRLWTDPDAPYGFSIEPIGAELVDDTLWARRTERQNEIRMGIEVDQKGAPVAYHVWNSLTEPVSDRRMTRVPAAEMIHVYAPKSAQQTRGISAFAPVMLALHHLDRYEEAELVACRVGAAKMGFFQSRDPEAGEYSRETTEPMSMTAAPATFEKIARGWELKEFNPEHPTTAYSAFVKGQLRRIASGLGVSYNALANDLEGVNYSSMRSGLLIERDMWRRLQRWWIGMFQQRVYEAWLANAILSGDLRLDSRDATKFKPVLWNPRGWAWVDPLKDVQAQVIAQNNGLGSRTEALAERGGDFETVVEQLAQEKELAEEADVEINGGLNKTGLAPEAADEPAQDNGNGSAGGNRVAALRGGLR